MFCTRNLIAILLIVTSFNVSSNQSLNSQKDALNIIANFADRICNKISTSGKTKSLELSGHGKVELKGLLKKIADLGVKGGIKYQDGSYESVLQKDLARMLRESSNCKLEVFKDLKDKLLTSSVDQKGNNSVTQPDTVEANSPIKIAGRWSYSSGRGEAEVIENDTKSVTIFLSFKPNRAPKPHYKIQLKRENNILDGTWVCLIRGIRGFGITNKVKFKIDQSGLSMVVLEGEDPHRLGLTRGFTLYKLSAHSEMYNVPQATNQTTIRKNNEIREIASLYRKSYLTISGTNVSVLIKESHSGVEYDGSKIGGTNTDNTIYLPRGQKLAIKITGINVDISIESSIAEFVSVNDSGTGTDVSEI